MKQRVMDAAVFEGEGCLNLKKIQVPLVRENEVLVKIQFSSICGSDVHILEVPRTHPAVPGIALGHEAVGVVVEIGSSVASFIPGDRVVIDPITPCGECDLCRNGKQNICMHAKALGVNINGVFAEYCAVSERNLYLVPDQMPGEVAVLVEPFACVLSAVKKLDFQVGSSVAIFGAGPSGIFFSKLLKAAGASQVIIFQSSKYRFDFAVQHSGAAKVLSSRTVDYETEIKEVTNGEGVDVVIDTVGCLIHEAICSVKPGGKVLLFGLNENHKETVHQYDLVRKEIQVLGSFVAKHAFPDAIKILNDKIIDIRSVATHVFPLVDIGKGLDVIHQKQAMKVIIRHSTF